MNFKKLNKSKIKDILAVAFFILFYLFIFLVYTKNGKYVFGSKLDFSMQHYTIPEYFRTLFYETHDLLPDFAFNLGGGENIYYFSYYGFLSPWVLVSYLFPQINMLIFTIIAMAVSVISSCILLYYYFKKNNCPQFVSFISTLAFLCASPLIFHAHRHIMFINYFPFLVLALFGIDKFLEEKRSVFLIISITLMIFTSYYYSVSGLVLLGIYFIYKYLKRDKFNFKDFFKTVLSLITRFLIGISISSILLLPTAYTLLNGRTSESSTINLIDLFKPHMYFVYNAYSMGLTYAILLAIILMLFKKKKENIFLSIVLLLISIFPIFNYILNGTLYINAKTLIPFILLAVITLTDYLKSIYQSNSRIWKYLYSLYVISSSIIVCFIANSKDDLMLKEEVMNDFNQNYSSYIEKLNEDGLYRINTSLIDGKYINKVGTAHELKTSMYSSTFNKYYKSFYTDKFNNPLPYRNKFMISASNNLLFQMFMGEKYLFTTKNDETIYKTLAVYDNIKVLENENVLPIGYATSNMISTEDFEKLKYPGNVLNILGNIVVGTKTTADIIHSNPVNLNYEVVDTKNLEYERTKNELKIIAQKNAQLTLHIADDLKGKLLLIDFDIADTSCKKGDLVIEINGIKNKLTCKEWKYYNENTNFAYVLSDLSNDSLVLNFNPGTYTIKNVEVSTIDYDILMSKVKEVTPFIFDKSKTKGDKIVGTINIKEPSYLTFSIPYDRGFKVKVDGVEKPYELVNEAFIGLEVARGLHDIELTFEAPYKKVGSVLSLIGIGLFIGVIIYERGKK